MRLRPFTVGRRSLSWGHVGLGERHGRGSSAPVHWSKRCAALCSDEARPEGTLPILFVGISAALNEEAVNAAGRAVAQGH